jgi:hypothetical protein
MKQKKKSIRKSRIKEPDLDKPELTC